MFWINKLKKVWILVNQVEVEIPLPEIKINDLVIIDTGEMIPVDGKIFEGMATIDQRALTGESQPVEKKNGDQVFASTVLITGKIYIQVEKSGQDTTIAQIGQILNQSTSFKSGLFTVEGRTMGQSSQFTYVRSSWTPFANPRPG